MMMISVNVPCNLNDWLQVPVLSLSYWASNKDHFCCFVVSFSAHSFSAGVLDLGQWVSPPLSLFHCQRRDAGGVLC